VDKPLKNSINQYNVFFSQIRVEPAHLDFWEKWADSSRFLGKNELSQLNPIISKKRVEPAQPKFFPQIKLSRLNPNFFRRAQL